MLSALGNIIGGAFKVAAPIAHVAKAAVHVAAPIAHASAGTLATVAHTSAQVGHAVGRLHPTGRFATGMAINNSLSVLNSAMSVPNMTYSGRETSAVNTNEASGIRVRTNPASAPAQPKAARINLRVHSPNNQNFNDAQVTVVAPEWVETALTKLSNEIFKTRDEIKFDVFDNDGRVISQMTFRNPLKPKDLVTIARNESVNGTGIINKSLYQALDFPNEVILGLRDLVRNCVIVGKDNAVTYGGYKIPLNPHSIPQPTYVCDLSGFQFQNPDNTGRLFLIPKNANDELSRGAVDSEIYLNTVGEPKPTKATIGSLIKKDNTRFVEGSFHGKAVYFDTKAYTAMVAQDFLVAGLTLNAAAKNEVDNLNFKFLKYGAGFFAKGFNPPKDYNPIAHGFPPNLNIRECFFEELIAQGIENGLRELLAKQATLPPNQQKIKRIELPFFNKDYPGIKKLCNQYGIEYARTRDDALQKSPSGFITATTNTGDPHVLLGNEMSYGSVDAAIGENLQGKGHKFSPILNKSMQYASLKVNPVKIALPEAIPIKGVEQPAQPKAVEPPAREQPQAEQPPAAPPPVQLRAGEPQAVQPPAREQPQVEPPAAVAAAAELNEVPEAPPIDANAAEADASKLSTLPVGDPPVVSARKNLLQTPEKMSDILNKGKAVKEWTVSGVQHSDTEKLYREVTSTAGNKFIVTPKEFKTTDTNKATFIAMFKALDLSHGKNSHDFPRITAPAHLLPLWKEVFMEIGKISEKEIKDFDLLTPSKPKTAQAAPAQPQPENPDIHPAAPRL